MTKLQAQFTSYMKKALTNDSIDYYRSFDKNKNFKHTSLFNEEVLQVSVSQSSGIDTFFFEKNNIEEIENIKLKEAINSLTDRQKEIFFMYADKIKSVDIAKKLQISDSCVRAIISIVRKKLRNYIQGD